MKSRIKGSHIIALLITAAIGLWMIGGDVVIGGQTPEVEPPAIAERTDAAPDVPFKVQVVDIVSTQREQTISVRGRTKADAIIPIRAETGGILEQRLVDRGDFVKSGDLVCVIEQGGRLASLESAKAALGQAQAEYQANLQLSKKGFATDIKMRQMEAALNAAKSQVRQAEIELSRVEVRANASGTVQDPIASVGDVLQQGAACITLNDSDPMFFTGQIAEREIGFVKPGTRANVSVVTGEQFEGEVSYVSPSADPQTRTFNTEIRLTSASGEIRDGLTATAEIILPSSQSFKISPSWISLADSGEVGVKTVDGENRVFFKPLQILSQSNQGFWVSGLEEGDRIITLGQEYVIAGELVEPVVAPMVKAETE